MKPIFFDFENSGLNNFIGETAVFIYGILVTGGYLGPKYHKNAFFMHENAISNINHHKYKKISYNVNKNNFDINYKFELPTIRKIILKNYFEWVVKPIIKTSKISIDDYLEELKP